MNEMKVFIILGLFVYVTGEALHSTRELSSMGELNTGIINEAPFGKVGMVILMLDRNGQESLIITEQMAKI